MQSLTQTHWHKWKTDYNFLLWKENWSYYHDAPAQNFVKCCVSTDIKQIIVKAQTNASTHFLGRIVVSDRNIIGIGQKNAISVSQRWRGLSVESQNILVGKDPEGSLSQALQLMAHTRIKPTTLPLSAPCSDQLRVQICFRGVKDLIKEDKFRDLFLAFEAYFRKEGRKNIFKNLLLLSFFKKR